MSEHFLPGSEPGSRLRRSVFSSRSSTFSRSHLPEHRCQNSDGRLPIDGLVGAVGRYDGLALTVLGMAVVIIAAVRFVRIRSQLDDVEVHQSVNVQFVVAFSAGLALIVTTAATYLALAA